MKKLLPKTAAILGMILSMVCVFYLMKAQAYTHFPDFFDNGSTVYNATEVAWGSGRFAVLVSTVSLVCYGIDVFLCVQNAIDKKDRIFNRILASLFGLCLLLDIWVLATVLRNYKTMIWFISYFLLFVFEIISVAGLFSKREAKERR